MTDKRMPIQSNKVNLAEKDIEDFLYEFPTVLRFGRLFVSAWTGRQVHVPSGIIDLLGYVSDADNGYAMGIAVVEVKNVDIDSSALTQVSRYAADIENILVKVNAVPEIYKIIVGPRIPDQRFAEADALGIHVVTFKASVSAEFSHVSWTETYLAKRNEQYDTVLSENDALAPFVTTFGYLPADDDNDEAVSGTTDDDTPESMDEHVDET